MMKWLRHVTYMEGKRNGYELLVGTPERNHHFGNLGVGSRIRNRCRDIARIFSHIDFMASNSI
jgi:hypothetical protein